MNIQNAKAIQETLETFMNTITDHIQKQDKYYLEETEKLISCYGRLASAWVDVVKLRTET